MPEPIARSDSMSPPGTPALTEFTGRGKILGAPVWTLHQQQNVPHASNLPIPLGLVSHTSATFVSSAGGTTAPIDTTGANFLVAYWSHGSTATGVTVSDSKGNTWVLGGSRGDAVSSPTLFSRTGRVDSNTPNVGPGHTFTITGTNGFFAVAFAAFRSGATWTAKFTNSAAGALPHGTTNLTLDVGDLFVSGAAGPGSITGVSPGTVIENISASVLSPSLGFAHNIAPNTTPTTLLWSGSGNASVQSLVLAGTWA